MHPAFRAGFEKTAFAKTAFAKTAFAKTAFAKTAVKDPATGQKITSITGTPTMGAKHTTPRAVIDMQRGASKAKRMGKDFVSGVGIGKGLMPKAFGLMNVADIFSKTKSMVGRTPGMTGVKL